MLKLIDGEWIVTIGRHAGKTLAWCVKYRSGWLIGWALCTAGVTMEEVDIVWAALEARSAEINAILPRVPLRGVEGI